MEEEFGARFAEAGLSRSHFKRLLEGEPVTRMEGAALRADQQALLQEAQTWVAGDKLGTVGGGAVAAGMGGLGILFFGFLGVAFLVSGLLGWLLVMKKHVLQCSSCGAVVPAS